MLPAGQTFNKDFFAATVLPSIVDDRALSRPKLKAMELFSILTTHDLISLLTNMTNLGSKDYIMLRTHRTWLFVIFGHPDISSIIMRDSSLMMTSY
jgi:hypothetical protein